MATLQEGDRIYLQTANGWWVYETRQVHIVEPSAVEVLDPNPMDPGGSADGQWLTLTTCHPPYTTLERMITHAEQADFVPLHEGPPAEIADSVPSVLEGAYRCTLGFSTCYPDPLACAASLHWCSWPL